MFLSSWSLHSVDKNFHVTLVFRSKQQLIPSQEEGQVVQHPILELLASGHHTSQF